jgi:hypothetical protein
LCLARRLKMANQPSSIAGSQVCRRMKALFTSCLASLLALASVHPSYADEPLATVNFSVERGLPFSLTLDGQPITHFTAQQVHLDTLTPGQHQVELNLGTPARGRRAQLVRATVWLTEGLETSFVLTQRSGFGWQLRQVSTAALPGYGYADQAGTYTQPSSEAAYNAPPDEGGYPSVPSPAYHPAPSYPPVAAPTYPASPAYPGVGAYQPINSDVAGLIDALKQCSFDDKRLPLFYQVISRSYVRADDLALMVRTMTYSDSQRQVAEFGYGHLSDPQNFHHVLAALTFATDASTVLDNLGLQRR